ncbi:hypothetical protein [Methylobacterium gnaphalii]|uniref:Uncharacterized protein n=1 Tax=Methylobacterium gnaphalii TaxID=1010610 RepID=A0A512JG34_9HYPH|nr:hypothetical protein [Methylobacterium gnaphalii]GEP08909.1 hypothetical protein MGN01_07540 [Methylobacterium gnaphalii]GJD70675.1 hypothetical protein MMMDOFMJ_3627 [Methylobacterium gnaphalii]GLS50445.1 hypothetical protein GCM10007885_32970 [Methylobacterium gnaphalii]
MSVKTSIPSGLSKVLDQAEGGLRTFVEVQRAAFDEMSERWQESDRAAAISDWLDSLEEVAEFLAECENSAI